MRIFFLLFLYICGHLLSITGAAVLLTLRLLPVHFFWAFHSIERDFFFNYYSLGEVHNAWTGVQRPCLRLMTSVSTYVAHLPSALSLCGVDRR